MQRSGSLQSDRHLEAVVGDRIFCRREAVEARGDQDPPADLRLEIPGAQMPPHHTVVALPRRQNLCSAFEQRLGTLNGSAQQFTSNAKQFRE